MTIQEYLVKVRDALQRRYGDHMVASTIFAKRIVSITRAYDDDKTISEAIELLSGTEFAGQAGYER